MFLSIFLCIASRENIKHKLVRFLEGIVNRFDAVGDRDHCEVGAVMESIGSDRRDAIRNIEGCQCVTVIEGIAADLCERIGQIHICQGLNIVKSIIRYLVRPAEFIVSARAGRPGCLNGCVSEHFAAHTCDSTGHDNFFQIRAIAEY